MGDILTETKNGIRDLMIDGFSSAFGTSKSSRVEVLVAFEADDPYKPPNRFPRVAFLNLGVQEIEPNVLISRNQGAQYAYFGWTIDFRIGSGGSNEDKMDEAAPIIAACFDALKYQNPREYMTGETTRGDKLELVDYASLLGFMDLEKSERRIPIFRQIWRNQVGIIENT